MNRVFSIPELLKLILTCIDEPRTQVISAIVCRKWSETALSILWHEVDDPIRLFSLLAPLGIDHEQYYVCYEFKTIPGPENWARFHHYSFRIRRLSYDSEKKGCKRLSASVLHAIATTSDRSDILPNLQRLDWLTTDLDLCLASMVFMHSRIEFFSLHIPTLSSRAPDFSSFIRHVLQRMPSLTTLQICANCPVRHVEADVSAMVGTLRKLKRTWLPMHYVTSKVAEELSKLVGLESIAFDSGRARCSGDISDVQDFSPSFGEGAFPALKDLNLNVRLEDLNRLLTADFNLSRLATLYIDEVSEASSDLAEKFLTIVPTACPLLEYLCLYLRVPRSSEEEVPPDAGRITYETLKRVLKFPSLKTFIFAHNYPLDMTDDNVEELASKWPHLTHISLNREPRFLEKASMTLRSLITFARHCPKLTRLGLYLDTEAQVDLSAEFRPLSNLSKLAMGLSGISDPDMVAAFLTRVCPQDCALDTTSLFNGSQFVESSAEVKARTAKWEEVKRVLPLLMKFGEAERKRREALDIEVDRLRAELAKSRSNGIVEEQTCP